MIYDSDDNLYNSCSSSSASDEQYASAISDDESLQLRDQLYSHFSFSTAKCFNIVHINAQSVHCHYPDLLSSFDSDLVHAVLISETFLKPALSSSLYLLPGYKLLRNDRTGKGGGGVAIYLRADLKHKIIDRSPSDYSNFSEHLFIEVIVNHIKILLGVFYSPSNQIDYFASLESKLEHHNSFYEQIIILGDFNTCLLKDNVRSRRLQSLITSVDMHILPLHATHHAPHSSPSLLDLVLVSDVSKVASHGQLPAPFSYHDLIFLSYKIRCPRRKPQFLFLRSFKNICLDRLRAEADSIDWSSVYNCSDLDSKVALFNRLLLDLFDKHAPLKKVKVKHAPAPWLSDNIKKAMSLRDNAKKRYRRSATDENWALFKRLRNRCSRMCRDAKRRHIHNSINNLNTARVWQFLKTIGVGKDSYDNLTATHTINVNELNTHFAKPPVTLNADIKSSTLNNLLSLPKPSCNSFSFTSITEDDVINSIKSISSKAVGDDGLQQQMFVLLVDELASIITYLLNYSLETGSFPNIWKRAHVIPLPKTSNPSLTQYRPISILPFLSKVLESIVHSQLSHYLSFNNLLSPFQSGFRPGHSTVTALVKVTDDIRLAMDQKLLTVVVLLDFSSAFNSVDFDILLGILSSLNLSTAVIEWFNSYLRGRSQSVRIAEASSQWCGLVAGVPQGGVLSPLLFSTFINAITKILTCKYHLYADDLQLYRHFNADNSREAISAINNDLDNIRIWAKSFGLLVNPSKSQALIIGGRYMYNSIDMSLISPIIYDNVPINLSDYAKNLGVYIDCNLSWRNHVAEVSRRVYGSFHSLRRLQYFLPVQTKITLAQSLLLPLLDYADVCFIDANEELLDKLERLQNLCIRFIFGLRKYDHVSKFRAQLKWLPIRRRRDCHILFLLYSILHNSNAPTYLLERFEYLIPRDKPCRTATSLLLKTPSHTSSRYGSSFTVSAIRLWNSLPHTIRASSSLQIFKRRTKEYFLSLA